MTTDNSNSNPSWGEGLWDKFDLIQRHASHGIEASQHTRNLFAKLAEAEKEYALKLAAICKAFENPPQGVTEGTDFAGVWQATMQCISEVSGAHNNLSTTLAAEVGQAVSTQAKETSAALGGASNTYHQNEKALQKALSDFDKARKVYDKVDATAESAKAHFEKIEKSDSGNRKKLELARRDYATKAKAREEEERNLQEALNRLNAFRTNHFFNEQRGVLDSIQHAEEKRSKSLVEHINQMSTLYVTVTNTEKQALDSLSQTCSAFNPAKDTHTFMAQNTTGSALPGDLSLDVKKKAAAKSPEKKHKREKSQTAAPVEEPTPPPQADDDFPPQVRLMYDFPGTNPGEIACAAGEVVYLQQDSGDGWMLVAKMDGTQGYIPSSYSEAV